MAEKKCLDGILDFQRKDNVRFILRNGETIGSGSYKKYDEGIACLTYMYVEPSEEYNEDAVYEELYNVLESDIIADGYKEIFLVGANEEIALYQKMGYRVGEERDADKLERLLGADVIHEVTMEKIL